MSVPTSTIHVSPHLEARHAPSRLNTRFNGAYLDFNDYVALNRDMIARVRARSNAADMQKIVEGNSPFELMPTDGYDAGTDKPFRRGILLTHGLTDSPYFMRALGKFFSENGFRVMAILLPGHGTQPGDLLDVRWKEWAKAVAYGTDRLAEEADEIYLAGYSAGAALSVYQSRRDSRVRGLFLFSPAFRISPRAAWAKWHSIYSWAFPPSKWVNIKADRDIYKYESFPKNAAAQMHELTQAVQRGWMKKPVEIPVFAAASMDDTTAQIAATLEFMLRARHDRNKLVLYATGEDKLPHGFPHGALQWVNSAIPPGILSSSHTAVVLPPDDAHYGTGGEYSNCVHYYPNDMRKYNACNSGNRKVLQGEITSENLSRGIVKRLMVNPHFPQLLASLKDFIQCLKQA